MLADIITRGTIRAENRAIESVKAAFAALALVGFILMSVDAIKLLWALMHRSRRGDEGLGIQAGMLMVFLYVITYVLGRGR